MNDFKQLIDEMVNDLKQQRDELQLKLHLAKLEVGGEWEKLEAQLANLDAKVDELGKATADASEDIAAAAKLLGDEIYDGFKKIARHF